MQRTGPCRATRPSACSGATIIPTCCMARQPRLATAILATTKLCSLNRVRLALLPEWQYAPIRTRQTEKRQKPYPKSCAAQNRTQSPTLPPFERHCAASCACAVAPICALGHPTPPYRKTSAAQIVNTHGSGTRLPFGQPRRPPWKPFKPLPAADLRHGCKDRAPAHNGARQPLPGNTLFCCPTERVRPRPLAFPSFQISSGAVGRSPTGGRQPPSAACAGRGTDKARGNFRRKFVVKASHNPNDNRRPRAAAVRSCPAPVCTVPAPPLPRRCRRACACAGPRPF